MLDTTEARKSNMVVITTKIIEETTRTIEPHFKEIDYKLEALLERIKKQHEEIKTLLTKNSQTHGTQAQDTTNKHHNYQSKQKLCISNKNKYTNRTHTNH